MGPVLLSIKDISCEEGPKVNMDLGVGSGPTLRQGYLLRGGTKGIMDLEVGSSTTLR